MSTRGVVVAVGGNALVKNSDEISVAHQAAAVAESAESIARLVEAGFTPVVTHGNGPQVGFLLRRAELALGELPPIPLDVLGADTQGATGYMFARGLRNALAERGISKDVAAIVTQTVVDPADPAFVDPTKPIGSFMSAEEAQRHEREEGWALREDSGRGYRRVVASPQPLEIVEAGTIKALADSGSIVIACGGGGIPVRRDDARLTGVEAVIDKDLASALLANRLGVQDFIICTAVDAVCLDFNKPTQAELRSLTIAQAREHLEAGQFGAGSMAPKIQATISFLERGGERVIITSLPRMVDALAGTTGTTITP
ncbi:carbamate kinase [Actinomyces denticolens]|uniref:Carbamate kinase n=1 Tax=Actinomyces denticolens TaxID=52767 RepID=A0ABY1IA64_9ACTO|nr:carbamate kinase [Actinomyces denticolens]SHI84895.1 carbamate kinase [Actinomyces denticolens]